MLNKFDLATAAAIGIASSVALPGCGEKKEGSKPLVGANESGVAKVSERESEAIKSLRAEIAAHRERQIKVWQRNVTSAAAELDTEIKILGLAVEEVVSLRGEWNDDEIASYKIIGLGMTQLQQEMAIAKELNEKSEKSGNKNALEDLMEAYVKTICCARQAHRFTLFVRDLTEDVKRRRGKHSPKLETPEI